MNGFFKFYLLMRIFLRGVKNVYFGKELIIIDFELVFGSKYIYYVIVGISVDNISSVVKSVFMSIYIFDNILVLKNVTVQSSFQIYMEWDFIVILIGIIDQYGVIFNVGKLIEIEKRVGMNFFIIVLGLKFYFIYDVRLIVCLAGEFNVCGIGMGIEVMIKEVLFFDMLLFILIVKGFKIVDIDWGLFLFFNGILFQYLIYYREEGFFIEFLINRVESDVVYIRYVGNDLKFFIQYQYRVVVGNKEGDVFSGWVLVRILEVLFVGVK